MAPPTYSQPTSSTKQHNQAARRTRSRTRKRFVLPDNEDRQGPFQSSPTGPWVAPPRVPADPSPAPQPTMVVGRRRRALWSTVFFALLVIGVGIRAYRDLSRPEAWVYWKESYFSPTMTSSVVAKINAGGVSLVTCSSTDCASTAAASGLSPSRNCLDPG